MCQTRTASHSARIALIAFAALAIAGCNKTLPTEPIEPMIVATVDAPPTVSGQEGASASTSTRSRPVRPTGTSSEPTSTDPGTEPSPAPEPTPTPPPTTTNPFPTPGTTPPDPTPTPTPAPTPTPPSNSTTDCMGPCDGILKIPSSGEVMAAIYAARDRVKTAVDRGELKAKNKVRNWNVVPGVEWKACFFWVENGFYYDANGNKIIGACAAGMTDYNRKTIVISTKEESRTLALVKWEATNYYLYLIGRSDLLDRWQ